MYSWEIRNLLEKRNYYIGGDELLSIINPEKNPQLVQIKFFSSDGSYYMKDTENEEFYFKAMDYNEAKEKGYVKQKIKKQHNTN